MLTYGKHLWASTEDLELKKHNYILLKLLNGDFHFKNKRIPLKSETFLHALALCPARYEFQSRASSLCLVAVGLIHRENIHGKVLFLQIEPRLQNGGWGGYAVGMGQGAAAQALILALQVAVMGGDEATDTSNASQAHAHVPTAAGNSPP